MKFWFIRVILGIVLGFGAAFVVEVLHIGLVVLAFGSLDEFLQRKPQREEFWLFSLGLSTMTGGALAAMIASFLGVMLAPAHCPDRLVVRAWLMAATLGAFAGSGVGGMLSLVHPAYLSFEASMWAVIAGGVLAGVAAAITLRVLRQR
jgi:hypothetical protein